MVRVVAPGAFGLAVVLWPVLAAVPAFVVALTAGWVLAVAGSSRGRVA